MDLQRDFLDAREGRMPVDGVGASEVLETANHILAKKVLADALPILVVTQFPANARIAIFFRRGAAVAGSAGAALDGRLKNHESVHIISKSSPSAFSNPELERYLHAHNVNELYVLGVFAEGCVRSTVIQAVKLGYTVHVIADSIATNAGWKKMFALWAMRRAGAKIESSLLTHRSTRTR